MIQHSVVIVDVGKSCERYEYFVTSIFLYIQISHVQLPHSHKHCAFKMKSLLTYQKESLKIYNIFFFLNDDNTMYFNN